jgi:hypothetical protein
MLGMIDGASVGIVTEPPATIGGLESYGIEQFYCVDYGSQRPRKMTPRQYAFLRGVIQSRKRDRLQARKDRLYHQRLEREARRLLAGDARKK